MRRLVSFVTTLCILAVGANPTPALTVLFPADGHRAPGSSVWLVVRSSGPVQARVDGREAGPGVTAGDVHHVRLENLRVDGSRVELTGDGGTWGLTVHGESDPPGRFHSSPPDICANCHDPSPDGCVQCHRWEGVKHEAVRAQGCNVCHAAPDWKTGDGVAVCTGCHRRYSWGKHPKLRHPMTDSRDPLRRGRRMGCASCHDPHAPRCLSCLPRAELREWCRSCHGKP